MKNVARLFFVPFLFCLLTAVIGVPSVQADQFLVIKINNYRSQSVSLAFARENGYNTSDTTTKGWYNVPARTSKTIKIFKYNSNDNYYWYAKSGGEAIVSGNDFKGWIVSGQAFTSQRGRKLGGGSRVGFSALKESKGKATINLGKR